MFFINISPFKKRIRYIFKTFIINSVIQKWQHDKAAKATATKTCQTILKIFFSVSFNVSPYKSLIMFKNLSKDVASGLLAISFSLTI